MSVENVFIAHTLTILKDIIQVKKNDFMLSQHELQISQGIIMDLISNKFDKKSMAGGANFDDLDRFWKYSDSLYTY